MKQIKNWTKWIYWFTFAVAIIAVYKTLDNFGDISIWLGNLVRVLMPFLMGALMAYILYIPCKSIEKAFLKNKFLKKRARGLSVITGYILTVLVITFIINIMLPAISESVMDLASNLPSYYREAMELVEKMPEDSIIKKETIYEMIEKLQQFDISKFLDMENIADYIDKAKGVVNTIFNTFVTIVMSVYILLERDKIKDFFKKVIKAMFKEETCEAIEKYCAKTNDIFFKFVASQVIDGIIIGIITSIAMGILGVKYAVLLGFIIGLFNIIPYFGAIIAVLIATIITIFTGGFTQAIWLLVIVTILQQLDANIINPRIVGNALKLSPILVVFSVTLFGAYFGVLGMFLAVPIIAILKIIVNDYLDHKIKTKNNKIEE